jgi:tetratricopeptide (TPR) repeat protein
MKYYLIFTLIVGSLLFACNNERPANQELPRIISTGNPAIDGLTAKIAAQPEDATLYAARAAAYYEMEGYDEAIADMAKAMMIDSSNLQYHFLLADIYLNYYKSQQAVQTLERAVQIAPNNVEALLSLAELQMVLKKHEASMKNVSKVLSINKLNPMAFFLMGMNLEQTGDEARAINAFQSAIENDPSMADAHLKLGQLFAQKGESIAIRYYDNAIAAAPNNPVMLYAKAEYLHNNNQLDEALETLRKAIVLDQQYLEAYFRSGVIYLEKDSAQQAYQQFDLIVQNDPANAKAYYYRGVAAEFGGNLDQAKADYDQALTFDSDYTKAKEASDRLSNVQ